MLLILFKSTLMLTMHRKSLKKFKVLQDFSGRFRRNKWKNKKGFVVNRGRMR